MSEKLNVHLRDKTDEKLFRNTECEIAERGFGALHDWADKYFRLWNIVPNYERQNDADFMELRKKLNTEAGVIISNHPGYVDFPAILKCIAREDIKIMVDKEGYEDLRKLIGDKYIVPAYGPSFPRMSAHIQNGGIVLLFPTGGDRGNQIDFKPGFTALLDRLKPDNMIYSFCVETRDVETIESAYHGRSAGVASALYFGDQTNVNRLRETKSFSVDERYSTAREWQEAIASAKGPMEKTILATKHYKDIYHIV